MDRDFATSHNDQRSDLHETNNESYELDDIDRDSEHSLVGQSAGHDSWFTPREWLWELLFMTPSLCCTSALIALLSRVKDRPYTEWSYSIGLNPTISILTTIARGTLLLPVSACLSQGKWFHLREEAELRDIDVFDQASRGPWGVLTILFGPQAYLGLATLAAAITVLALSIGPFTQQVVWYDQQEVSLLSDNATFRFADSYDSGIPVIGEGYVYGLTQATEDNVGSRMIGSIFRGLYQDRSQWTPSFQCPTNCTWPDAYTILGFAGTCSNVTALTLATKNCTEETISPQNCTMSTPRGIMISTLSVPTMDSTAVVLNSNTSSSHIQRDNSDVVGQTLHSAEFAKFAIWSLCPPDSSREDPDCRASRSETVWECSLNFTAWKYSGVA